jgi:hypothetical protein
MGAAHLKGPVTVLVKCRNFFCDGKERFDSAVLARTAALRKERRNHYRCHGCGGWHVGNDTSRHLTSKKIMKELIR